MTRLKRWLLSGRVGGFIVDLLLLFLPAFLHL